MKNKTRCYFHQQTQARQRQLRNNRMLPMPVIEDVPSIQLALMDIVNRLAQGTIEARNAGLILYALQIASSNLRTGRFTSKGWQDYQSKNAKLVRTEEIEERSQSAPNSSSRCSPRAKKNAWPQVPTQTSRAKKGSPSLTLL